MKSSLTHRPAGWGGPDIALDVWVTQEQEGWKGERVLRNLLLLHNPDAQSSVWATPPVDNTATPSEIACTTRLGGLLNSYSRRAA